MKALRSVATEIENMTPQVVTAARIVYRDPDNDSAQRRMEDLKHRWANTVSRLAGLIDDVTDPRDYVMAAGGQLAISYVRLSYLIGCLCSHDSSALSQFGCG